MGWDEVVKAVEGRLSPEDFRTFKRLHGHFTGYLSETTLSRFYGFVFARGLQLEVNGYRFHRLERILAGLAAAGPATGQRVLELGAGAGILAEAAKSLLSPREYVVQDICPGPRDFLASRGHALLPHPAPASPPGGPFDLILAADALGEINSDEDGFLRDPANETHLDFAEALEERYGFAQKLAPWKPYLAAAGKLLLWEPFSRREIWGALAGYLAREGWQASLREPLPGGEFLELSIAR